MRIVGVSRQYLYVPVRLLTARPLLEPVAMAVVPDGRDPGPGDWRSAGWLSQGGRPIGCGWLVGPGGGTVYRAGRYAVWVREALAGGELPVWKWTRLRIGAG
jgi:hypothetical protein